MSPDKPALDELRIDRAPPARPHSRRGPLVIAFLLTITAGGVIWWLTRPKAAVVRTVAVPAPALTASGQKTLLDASGYVTARRDATVSSKVTGKVVEVLVEEGMRVENGQVLARIDSSNVETALHLAEAQLEAGRRQLGETEASLAQAERELERLRRAAERNAATPLELERAETATRSLAARLERQRAEVTVAEREVEVWRQQLDDTIIRAPFAGIVTAKNAQPGEMISPMSV